MADQDSQPMLRSSRPQKRGTGVFLPRTAAITAAYSTSNYCKRATPGKARKGQQLCSSRAPSTARSSQWQHHHPNLLSACSIQHMEASQDLAHCNSWSADGSQLAAQPGLDLQHMYLPASNRHASNSCRVVFPPAVASLTAAVITVHGGAPPAVVVEAGTTGVTIISAPVHPNHTDLLAAQGSDSFPQMAPENLPSVYRSAAINTCRFSSVAVLGCQVPAATVCFSNSSSGSWPSPAGEERLACAPITAGFPKQRRSHAADVQHSPTDIPAGSERAAAEAGAHSSCCARLEDILSQELLTYSSGSSSMYTLCMNSNRATPCSGASAACSNTSSTQSSPVASQAVQQQYNSDGLWHRQYSATLFPDLCTAYSSTIFGATAVHNSHALQLNAAASPNVLSSSSSVLPSPFSGTPSPAASEAGTCPARFFPASTSDSSFSAGAFPASTILAGTCPASTNGSSILAGTCSASTILAGTCLSSSSSTAGIYEQATYYRYNI